MAAGWPYPLWPDLTQEWIETQQMDHYHLKHHICDNSSEPIHKYIYIYIFIYLFIYLHIHIFFC